MKIGFNPAIKNQNMYSAKCNASEQTSISNNQLAFKKVNQEFYKMAEESFKDWKDVTSEWYEWLTDDFAWNIISKQDALDTMNVVREWVNKESLKAFENMYKYIENY